MFTAPSTETNLFIVLVTPRPLTPLHFRKNVFYLQFRSKKSGHCQDNLANDWIFAGNFLSNRNRHSLESTLHHLRPNHTAQNSPARMLRLETNSPQSTFGHAVHVPEIRTCQCPELVTWNTSSPLHIISCPLQFYSCSIVPISRLPCPSLLSPYPRPGLPRHVPLPKDQSKFTRSLGGPRFLRGGMSRIPACSLITVLYCQMFTRFLLVFPSQTTPHCPVRVLFSPLDFELLLALSVVSVHPSLRHVGY